MKPFLATAVLAWSCLAAGCRATPPGEAEAIDTFMRRTVPFGFSGSLLVARRGHVNLADGYGLADRERGIAYSRAVVFPIGSLTKQFTAAAILKLEMQGRLEVGDLIGRHLPGVPADKAAITIHQLLTHTSGLASDFGEGDDQTVTRDALLHAALSSVLQAEPGAKFSYSNAGYGLLAAIIEIRGGRSYAEFVRDELFLPAGMERTGDPGLDADPALLPHGYEGSRDLGTVLDRMRSSPGPHWNLVGNGGLLSTLDDLQRWDRALVGTDVLSEPAKRKLFAPHVATGEGEVHYGYGWYVSKTVWSTRLIWHTGGDGVFFAGIRRYVDDDVTIVHSSNVASLWSEYPVRGIEGILFGRPFELPPRVIAMPPGARRFEGTFRLAAEGGLTLALHGDELRVTPIGQEAYGLLAGAEEADEASLARHQELTAALLAARDRGDFSPLARAMADGSDAAGLAQGWRQYLRDEQPTRGDYRTFSVIGSRPAGSWTVTQVRLIFARSELLLDYLWDGDRLVAVQFSSHPGYVPFRPTGEGTFASYDIVSGKSATLALTGDELTIASLGRSRAATRNPAAVDGAP